MKESRGAKILCFICSSMCIIPMVAALVLVIIADPALRLEKRVIANCTVIATSKMKQTSISDAGGYSYWLYTVSFNIYPNLSGNRMERCMINDGECIKKYDGIFIMHSRHICKYYGSNPSYLLLVDGEEDSPSIHFTLMVTIFASIMIVPIICTICACYLCNILATEPEYQSIE